MTSFYYASTPTRDNWFQTNQSEHELDDLAGDPVTSVCVLRMRKMQHCRRQIWSTFVTVCSKTKITDGTWIGFL